MFRLPQKKKSQQFECQTTETFQLLSIDRQKGHLLKAYFFSPLILGQYFQTKVSESMTK